MKRRSSWQKMTSNQGEWKKITPCNELNKFIKLVGKQTIIVNVYHLQYLKQESINACILPTQPRLFRLETQKASKDSIL